MGVNGLLQDRALKPLALPDSLSLGERSDDSPLTLNLPCCFAVTLLPRARGSLLMPAKTEFDSIEGFPSIQHATRCTPTAAVLGAHTCSCVKLFSSIRPPVTGHILIPDHAVNQTHGYILFAVKAGQGSQCYKSSAHQSGFSSSSLLLPALPILVCSTHKILMCS